MRNPRREETLAVAMYAEALQRDPPLKEWKQIHADLRTRFNKLQFERIKREARGNDKAKHMVCRSCGESIVMTVRATPARAHAGLCVGCFRQSETMYASKRGHKVWSDTGTRIGGRGKGVMGRGKARR